MKSPRCEKADCPARAAVYVTLEAADGTARWWACRRHAQEFKAWVIEAAAAQGEAVGSLEILEQGRLL